MSLAIVQFIHSKLEIYPKSSLKRKKEYEFEEIILKNIENIHLYLLSVNFENIETYYKSKYDILLFQKTYDIKFDITIKEQKIDITYV